jgi:hypothetical protein
MAITNKLSRRVIEKLGWYVYLYIDPFSKKIFYGGKGKGNRAFAHLNASGESQKVTIIRKIRRQGKEPRIDILVHGLKNAITALQIEAAAIDLLGKSKLTNENRGWGEQNCWSHGSGGNKCSV